MECILDWEAYCETARRMAAEGSVLLKNEKSTLPLSEGTRVSVFGRIQDYYYKSGTGSGGMVNVSKTYSILEGLRSCGRVTVNEELATIYAQWSQENPIDEGQGWGNEPWSQREMPLTVEQVSQAAQVSDAAVVIIGRTAGEDKDASNELGSYQLDALELAMLHQVRSCFERVIVVLNIGGLVDLSFMDTEKPDAVLIGWQGGMLGGLAVADVLTGVTPPSGHLTDTIAYEIKDYSSDANFGDPECDIYAEDIYVGYRYFNTFAPSQIRYPFGYGLTYTEFEHIAGSVELDEKLARLQLASTNVGARAGKDVVQIYVKLPQGKLGKPAYTLIDYQKTQELGPGESQELQFTIPMARLASYDDCGATGARDAFVLEAGAYTFYAGKNSMELEELGSYVLENTLVVQQCEEALAPQQSFRRIKPSLLDSGEFAVSYEAVPVGKCDMDARRAERIPAEIPQTGNQGIRLVDVLRGKATMEQFIAQLSDEDLACMVRGEGMGSSLVTPGTASAFGGVSKELRDYGIPAVCCDDGPSGMRLDCGTKAFSLPNGTLIASSFDDALTEKLFEYLGMEMTANRVDALLGPGMNLHRHPLNGRNFEYFSEDPLLTGRIAAAQLRGLHRGGATGVLKHFAANNQEFCRRQLMCVISQRALRELYLASFKIAVQEGGANAIMTTYGGVNGRWTASNYDLTTTILRKDWGYQGIVMTDWWAVMNEPDKAPSGSNFAAMVRAQNDLYMVCPDGSSNRHGDNTMESLEAGTLTRAELQRCATNICTMAMHTEAMRRLCEQPSQVTIPNRPKDEDEVDLSNVTYIKLQDFYEEDLTVKESRKGTNYLIPLDVDKLGMYEIKLTVSSELGALAQIPVTFFYTGIPVAVFTFNGTEGKSVTVTRQMPCPSRFAVLRFAVGGNGLRMEKLEIAYKRELQKGDLW